MACPLATRPALLSVTAKDLALDVLGHSALVGLVAAEGADAAALQEQHGVLGSGGCGKDLALDVLGQSALVVPVVAEGADAAALQEQHSVPGSALHALGRHVGM